MHGKLRRIEIDLEEIMYESRKGLNWLRRGCKGGFNEHGNELSGFIRGGKTIDKLFFPLALQPNSGLGRLHETFRFTSVTRTRTVGRTTWTVDQLVARPLPIHKHRKTHTLHKH
jgi:hypothetical protein